MNDEVLEIVAAFQSYRKKNDQSEIERFYLAELQHAEQQLGIEESTRLGIHDRIAELQQKEQRKYERKKGWGAWVMNGVLGIIVLLVGHKLIQLLFGG